MTATMHLKSLQRKRRDRTKYQLKQFLSLIYVLNVTCQFFGVAPILDTPHRKRRALRRLHYIWCAILVIYIYVVNSYYATRLHESLVTILKVFFISEFINNPLIVFLIAITIYYYSELYQRIPHELFRIYKSYTSFQPTVWTEKDLFHVLRREVLQMICVVSSIVMCCLVVEYKRTEFDFIQNVLNASVFNLPNILISLNLGQYWLSLRFVQQLYRGFNEILKQRLREFRSTNFTTSEDKLDNDGYSRTSEFAWYQREFYSSCSGGGGDYKILKSIRGPYFDLDVIMAQLTKVFGIILLLNFLGSVLSLSVECFAIYKFFDAPEYLGDELAEVYHRWLIICIHVGRLLLILVANNAIIEEKCRTSFVINELCITSKEMEHEVNRFLLRLMGNQSAQMAYGVIDLDLLVLSGIAGVIANYIIFLIQIDLGSITMEGRVRNMTAMREDIQTIHYAGFMSRLMLTHQFIYQWLKLLFVHLWHGMFYCYTAIGAAFAWGAEKLHAFGVDLGEETGILAISLMANRRLHAFERFLWFCIVFVSMSIAILLSSVQLNRYMNSPTVISMDRDYRGWHGLLPAVTLCYYDHIDSFKANEYIQNHWNASIIDDDYFYFMDFLHAVVNATASNYVDLARFAEDERFEEVDLIELVHAINKPFEQTLISFDKQNSKIQIIPVMTERGFCYVVNSPISEILAGRKIEYKDITQPLGCEYGKQQCFIKMDLYESTGTVDVHSPFEVSASGANVIALHKSDEIIASFKVLETVASNNLRDLDVDQRKCVFYDEETSHMKVYSKTLCLVRCRAVMALEMCNCVPFFYAFVDGPSCSPAGFECLMDFKWPIWALHICKCPSTCTEIEYTVQTVKKSFWGVKTDEELVNTIAVTSSFRWDVITPKVRMRRDVVFGFEDLIVSFGGTLALFLGFSQISIVRFGYVVTYHLFLLIAELFVGLKNNCVRGLQNWKCMEAGNCKFLKKEKLRSRKRTEQLIGVKTILSKADNLSYVSTAATGAETPEFEYIN